jgi:hypothetical protein
MSPKRSFLFQVRDINREEIAPQHILFISRRVTDPGEHPNPADWRTEVYWPLTK